MMTPSEYDRVREIFLEVYDRPVDERSAYLDEHATNAEQRREVEALLAHHDDLTTFLDPAELPTLAQDITAESWPWEPRPGDKIGPYVVRRLIGEGGFGTVCEADQTVPVRRRVALKILKAGLDTREIITRFEAERQALALMEHRFIAKVLDAGTTPTGRPYFVMEFVAGVPITRFCEQHGLDIEQRQRLFLQVCEAVQHAHQKGIIHRDIKPSNVLVTVQGERRVPKIIDFGIAKATGPVLGERTTVTAQGQLVGTPAYMSPEQADLGTQDIDTRSDIYSLGALLYELLVGLPPFDGDTLRGAGLLEIQRILRDMAPLRPSARVAELMLAGELPPGAPSSHGRTLQRQLKGDLDWIVLKAMEKERARRYPAVLELAADIKRHLAFEPVIAGPPSKLYRLSKLTRRHRAGVAAAVLVTLALAIGFVAVTWQRARAEREAMLAANLIQTIADVFRPSTARNVDMAVVGEMSQQLEAGNLFADKPEIHAKLLGWMAWIHRTLGNLDDAERVWRRAVDERSLVYGPTHRDTLSALNLLADTLHRQGKNDDAERFARTAYLGSLEGLSPEDPITLRASAYLATALSERGHFEEAESLLREAWATQIRCRGEEHIETLVTVRALAALLLRTERLDEADELLQFVVKTYRRTRGRTNKLTLAALREHAQVHAARGKFDEARSTLRSVLTAQIETLGETHFDTQKTRADLIDLLTTMGADSDADALRQEAQEASGPSPASPVEAVSKRG